GHDRCYLFIECLVIADRLGNITHGDNPGQPAVLHHRSPVNVMRGEETYGICNRIGALEGDERGTHIIPDLFFGKRDHLVGGYEKGLRYFVLSVNLPPDQELVNRSRSYRDIVPDLKGAYTPDDSDTCLADIRMAEGGECNLHHFYSRDYLTIPGY